ncbi:MAG TPA: hypothetical protein VHF01_12880 [Candidatus Acidoferrum sp.]|nr:hypothetical protein [Candidatus Acidoferrum sp.]
MSAYTPNFAPVVVLLFLGAVFVTGITLLVLFYGAVRRSEFFASLGAMSALVVTVGYGLVLCGVSIASSEKVLPPGGWKYFCEIDCHFAYSLIGAQTSAALGPEMQQISARGKFVVVRVKTWFDERTISAHRGNGPLTPNPRKVVLVDDTGRSFAPSAESQAAFARLGNTSTLLTEPLRPGESYTTDFVFDVPKVARGLRLLITEEDPETRLVIGHENSLLHKKIYSGVASAPPLTKAAQ